MNLPCLLAATGLLFASPAFAQKIDSLKRSFNLGSGGSIVVKLDRGSITVETGGANASVQVLRTARGGDAPYCERLLRSQVIEFTQRDSALYLDADEARGEREFYQANAKNLGVDVRIVTPRAVNLTLQTGAGAIRVTGSITGKVTAEAGSGSIKILSATDTIDATATNGSVTIGKGSGAIRARTSSGSITISDAIGPVDATAERGSVELTLAQQPRSDIDLSANAGSIVVNVAKNVGLHLDADATGSVRVDLPIQVERQTGTTRLSGNINGGGVQLDASAKSGSVRVLKLN